MPTPDDLKIDKDSLDEALMRQPELLYEAGEASALAVSLRDQASDNVKRVDAEVALDIRDNAAKSGDKITEAAVAAEVLTTKEHKKAIEDLNAAKLSADKAGALREAFHARSQMLRSLVELYVAGYFSSRSVSSSNPKVGEVQVNTTRAKLSGKREEIASRVRERVARTRLTDAS